MVKAQNVSDQRQNGTVKASEIKQTATKPQLGVSVHSRESR